MKNKIHYAATSRRDLDDIWDYIVSDLSNPGAAFQVVNRILDDIDALENYSGIGTPLAAIANTDREYRYLVSGNYMVFYRVSGSDVYIDRILYSRRDYLHILFDEDMSS